VVSAAGNHEEPVVRDLFEPFLPEDQRVRRLGDVFAASDILALEGDAVRGKRLFHEARDIQCRSCHRVHEQGNDVGPDLTRIGKKYDPRRLLESILEPSKNIDPQFATWLIETVDGKVHSGLLVDKDEDTVVLKDAQNKQHRLPRERIDGMYPQRKSLMPDLLLRDLTAQQAADLLAYLASLRD
jgi:putative heme-binding domain-containing protein